MELYSFVAGLVIGLIVIMCFVVLICSNMVNLNDVGQYMCAQHNLTFVKATQRNWMETEGFAFQVVCKQSGQQPIDDHYLFIEESET